MARILIADDERILTDSWRSDLEDAGHDVTVAHTGLQTLGYLQDQMFDLLITDMNMPDGGGFIVTMEAHSLNDQMPVIVITGDPAFLSSGVLSRMPSLGADNIVAKPIGTDALLKLVESSLSSGPRKNLRKRLSELMETARNYSRAKPN